MDTCSSYVSDIVTDAGATCAIKTWFLLQRRLGNRRKMWIYQQMCSIKSWDRRKYSMEWGCKRFRVMRGRRGSGNHVQVFVGTRGRETSFQAEGEVEQKLKHITCFSWKFTAISEGPYKRIYLCWMKLNNLMVEPYKYENMFQTSTIYVPLGVFGPIILSMLSCTMSKVACLSSEITYVSHKII